MNYAGREVKIFSFGPIGFEDVFILLILNQTILICWKLEYLFWLTIAFYVKTVMDNLMLMGFSMI